MPNKPLVIDVEDRSIPNGSLNQWTVLNNAGVFINDIRTPALGKKANVGALVSGIPSAFARVDLFKAAFDSQSAQEGKKLSQNLSVYLKELVSEWRGFVACIALDYPNIRVKRIDLTYSDGKKITETSNIYEPAGAFGNMLLERRKRWCDQGVADNEERVPFLNLVKYCGNVVGATSPETLLFTSSAYRNDTSETDRPWVDVTNGKFIDPLKSDLSESQTITLFAYISHILNHLDEVEGQYPKELQVNYDPIRKNLELWKEEIEIYSRKRNYSLHAGSVPPVDAGFTAPFDKIFTFEDHLYGVEGQIHEVNDIEGAVGFDPKKLLLPPNAKIARLHLGPEFSKYPEKVRELPVFLLTATKKGAPGEHAFFSLPLSALGLNVYGKGIGPLVGVAVEGTMVTSTLNAIYNPEALEDNLEVTLSIKTGSGKIRKYTQQYTVGNSEGLRDKDIILWPNFVSRQWNQYYLFSELPHNGTLQTYKAYPFLGDLNDQYFRILTDDDKNPIFLADQGEIIAPKDRVSAELLVSSGNAVAENAYKYEIYKSDKPFKGVRLLSPDGKEGGFLIVNYSSDPGSSLPRNMLGELRNLDPVTVGIDFGSTNTSIAYSTSDGTIKGLEFTNQRVSLLSDDNGLKGLRENKILFFQGPAKPLKSNAIHSVLTLHDSRRLRKLKQGESAEMRSSLEVLGGFPSFVDNLPVDTVTEGNIYLKYPNSGQIVQVHNMKWSDADMEIAHKKAYLRSLLLHVYAQLFVEGIRGMVPTKLRWSFPSAMNNQLLSKYQLIWDHLKNLQPVLEADGHPYPLEVSECKGVLNMNVNGGWNAGSAFGNESFGEFKEEPLAANSWFSSFGSSQAQNDNEVQFYSNPKFEPDFKGNAPDDYGDFVGDAPKSNKRKTVDLKPDDPQRVVRYEAKPLFRNSSDNNSLTEANAVANFMSGRYGDEIKVLNICFDIGGSTTDISALYKLSEGLTMIKQNSIRFAAQRVSGATRYIKDFEKVLNQVCEQFNLTVLGLNKGDSRYSPDTAPYYFGQVVDRLTDEQLPAFYKLIAAGAPQLMCVNLYVTGLLMYYAGQTAYKLVEDIFHLDPEEAIPGTTQRPYVRIAFAGKGSRLMQWLTTTNPQAAQQYYFELFMKGFGGKQAAQKILGGWPQIVLPSVDNSGDIKFEVSKGLAKSHTDLCNPKDDTPSEIIGESGFSLRSADGKVSPVRPSNSLTPEMIENIGTYFTADTGKPCGNFSDFCYTFYSAAQQLFDMKISQEVFMEGFRNMNITQYVQNLPEFITARNNKPANNGKFDFVAPIIILEGMKFYDDYLIKSLK